MHPLLHSVAGVVCVYSSAAQGLSYNIWAGGRRVRHDRHSCGAPGR